MYSTTLRLDEDLARFLQEEARAKGMSVNALLAELVRQARELRARDRLTTDWSTYARDAEAQDLAFTFPAQSELAAEPKAESYRDREQP